MIRRAAILALAALLAGWGTAPARAATAETVESDISFRNIAIESNFTGQRIVVFGTIENSRHSEFLVALYDVVAVIRGPRKSVVVRRKDRVAGIWINREAQTFGNVPGYYAVLSTRPLEKVADPNVLSAYGLGFSNLDLRPLSAGEDTPASIDAFRKAVSRIKQDEGLYYYRPDGISFVGRNLFRATVDLPANVPVGQYATDVYLLRDGKVLSHNRSQLVISKEGFERFVNTAAYDYPMLYGIVAVIIAVSAGLIASALTRRE